MKFQVLPKSRKIPEHPEPDTVYLCTDNWDDFGYKTSYALVYIDADNERHEIGPVKIGSVDIGDKLGRPVLLDSFEALPDEYFSLGQEREYYAKLMELAKAPREAILKGLQDIAFNTDAYERALDEHVTRRSLMRFVARKTIEQQYRRILEGKDPLTEYRFAYYGPPLGTESGSGVDLEFHIKPNSRPPSNIHVLVGRNGVGKTHILNAMSRGLGAANPRPERDGEFESRDYFDDQANESPFANLLSISFSAFDDFHELPQRHDERRTIRHTIVGLQKKAKNEQDEWVNQTRAPEELAKTFAESAKVCVRDSKAKRWRAALNTLEADPLFAEAEVSSLLDVDAAKMARMAKRLYRRLSSGHKIVLLTITKLVENVEEKTLVLIDEPEAHLHPPLLSAFLRALSDLLMDRNGVAIVATHSPVVLQEVPQGCVWKIVRHGRQATAHRPDIETFGEGVGILTKEVFGLEVTRSGFHKMLLDATESGSDVDQILSEFDNEVGSEGRSLVASMLANKNK